MSEGLFKIHKGANFKPRSDQPANPEEGSVYRDDGTNRAPGLYEFRNGAWLLFGEGGAGGGGDDIISSQFQVHAQESFSEDISETASLVNVTQTDENLFDDQNEYIRIEYDATNSVTGTGTSMTLSAAPSFTVVVDDILRVGTEARRITDVGSINSDGGSGTPFTIEAAFSTDPSSAAATVSQAVYTKDLNNHTGGELAPSAEFTSTISEILVDYADSEAADDTVRDLVTPHVAYTASANGTDYTLVKTREMDVTTEIPVTSMPASGTNLYLRFFSNETSGTGFVNVLQFDTYFHRDTQSIGGEILDQAIAFTDETGTPVNATVDNSGTNTRILLDWSYVVSVRSGENNGQIEVYLNGQKIPRFIDSTLTPDSSYTEVDPTAIELDSDYSASNLSVEVIKRRGVVDTNDENSTRINKLEIGINQYTTNVNSQTATVTIPDGEAIGTRRLIRKVNPNQGTITINSEVSETFTRAGLSSVALNADGDYWLLEKVTSSRWDLIDGFETGENSNGDYFRYADGVQECRDRKTFTIPSGNNINIPFTYAKAFLTKPAVSLLWQGSSPGSPAVFYSIDNQTNSSGNGNAQTLDFSSFSGVGTDRELAIIAKGRWYQ
mgnify:CR=1 FL=1